MTLVEFGIYAVCLMIAMAILGIIVGTRLHARQPKKPDPDKCLRGNVPARVGQILEYSAMYRERLAAMEEEFVSLHGFPMRCDESDELGQVIWSGANYEECLDRIWEYKRG